MWRWVFMGILFSAAKSIHSVFFLFFHTRITMKNSYKKDKRLIEKSIDKSILPWYNIKVLNKRVLFNGRIPAFQAGCVGSIPITRSRKRQIPAGICRFQLNPPLRGVKYCFAIDGEWVDLISHFA